MKRHLHNFMERFTTYWWGDRGLSALLVLLLLSFMLSSLFSTGIGRLITSIFLSLLLVSGVASISAKKIWRVATWLLVLTGIFLTWAKYFSPDSRQLHAWSDAVSFIFLALLTLVVIQRVFQEGPVTSDRIRGAMAAYILVGFTWSLIYHLIEVCAPGSFRLAEAAVTNLYQRQSDFTYYSFITMTTVGYGDITPVHPLARMLAVLEALIGQLYPATLLARLVSLQIMHRSEEAAREKARGK